MTYQTKQEVEELLRPKINIHSKYNEGLKTILEPVIQECWKKLEPAIHAQRMRDLEAVEKIAEAETELHTHNSIPSYTADADEGCVTCIENRALERFVKKIQSLKQTV